MNPSDDLICAVGALIAEIVGPAFEVAHKPRRESPHQLRWGVVTKTTPFDMSNSLNWGLVIALA